LLCLSTTDEYFEEADFMLLFIEMPRFGTFASSSKDDPRLEEGLDLASSLLGIGGLAASDRLREDKVFLRSLNFLSSEWFSDFWYQFLFSFAF
jgi:hypothetical protein